jgi:hypothetical protein
MRIFGYFTGSWQRKRESDEFIFDIAWSVETVAVDYMVCQGSCSQLDSYNHVFNSANSESFLKLTDTSLSIKILHFRAPLREQVNPQCCIIQTQLFCGSSCCFLFSR